MTDSRITAASAAQHGAAEGKGRKVADVYLMLHVRHHTVLLATRIWPVGTESGCSLSKSSNAGTASGLTSKTMVTVSQVLAELTLEDPSQVTNLVPEADRLIRDLYLLDDLRQVGGVPSGTLLLLTRQASAQAVGYELDVALRRLPNPAGLIIQDNCERPSSTGIPLASRLNVPLLLLRQSTDLGALFRRIARLIHAEVGTLLERTEALLELIDDADRRNEDALKVFFDHDPFGFFVGPAQDNRVGAPIVFVEEGGDWLQRDPSSRFEDIVCRLLSWRLSASATRHRLETERLDQLNLQSVSALLDHILSESDEAELRKLLRQARIFGLPIDGWHEAVLIDLANLSVIVDNDPVAEFERAESLARLAVQTANRAGGTWNMVKHTAGFLLFRTRSRPRTPKNAREMIQQMSAVIDAVLQHTPELALYCGIGTSHEGASGLAATRSEAESAAQSARLRGTTNRPVLFDAPGIRRLLLEWYSSTTVRQSIDELLEPLNGLGSDTKKTEYLETLRIYLDTNRSIAQSAERLFVHRNTVAYRIKKIVELLDVDLDDPHQALSIHLACHAELGLHPSVGTPLGTRGLNSDETRAG